MILHFFTLFSQTECIRNKNNEQNEKKKEFAKRSDLFYLLVFLSLFTGCVFSFHFYFRLNSSNKHVRFISHDLHHHTRGFYSCVFFCFFTKWTLSYFILISLEDGLKVKHIITTITYNKVSNWLETKSIHSISQKYILNCVQLHYIFSQTKWRRIYFFLLFRSKLSSFHHWYYLKTEHIYSKNTPYIT